MSPDTHNDSDQAAPRPDGTDGQPKWRSTVYVVWISQVIGQMGFAFAVPFLPLYVRELGITEESRVRIWAGLLAFAPGIMLAVFTPLWGWLADRYGRKLMLARAVFSGAVLLTLMGMVTNAHQLLALHFIQGMLTGTTSATLALVASITPSSQMGYSMGLMETTGFVGYSVGPLLGGAAADYMGYRQAFYMAGGLLFLSGILLIIGARENFIRPSKEALKANGDLRSVAGKPGFGIVLAILFMINVGYGIAWPIFPLFVEQALSVGSSRAASMTGLILGVGGMVAACSAVIVGRISDRIGHKKVLTFSTLASGLFSIPHAVITTVGQALGVRALFGASAGGTGPAINAIVARMSPRDARGRAYGISFAATTLGGSIGPLVGGFVASALGLRLPFVIMGAMLVITSGVVAFVLREGEDARTV